LRALLADGERTELAFEISLALDGSVAPGALEQILSEPTGRRLYEERPSLLAHLGDRAALARLPDGSFGRAYLDHIDRYALDPRKLIELGRATGGTAHDDDPGLRWAIERGQLRHDLFHVLTGYGADSAGEAALLPFSLAQAGGRANALLSVGASLRMLREHGPAWLPYVWKSWRRGRRAVCLAAVPFEQLLALPLDEVRELLRIDPPKRAHPGGVLRSAPAHDS
jgi:ubiquinone biosynthesis protein COQ4